VKSKSITNRKFKHQTKESHVIDDADACFGGVQKAQISDVSITEASRAPELVAAALRFNDVNRFKLVVADRNIPMLTSQCFLFPLQSLRARATFSCWIKLQKRFKSGPLCESNRSL